jgi:hypothetical protein
VSDEDWELSDEARAQILDAAQKQVDSLPHAAGGVITGFVLIVESVRPGEDADLVWTSGNGMPTSEGAGGIARWRLLGMLEDVKIQAQAAIWRWRLRGEERDEDL